MEKIQDVRTNSIDSLKVQVLLAEYGSLRSHIVARTTASIQTVTLSVTALALIVSQIEAHPATGGILMCILLFVVAGVGTFIYSDLKIEQAHVRRLEKRINDIAHDTLLTYETEYGISRGLWYRLRYSLFPK